MFKSVRLSVLTICCFQLIAHASLLVAQQNEAEIIFEAGHPSLQKWRLPDNIPTPEDNPLTASAVNLGQQLFFDPRLSANGKISCASCHSPEHGWSDALPLSKGINDVTLKRASPSLINVAYNTIFMWDGRAADLESQALMPITAADEMGLDLPSLVKIVSQDDNYQKAFAATYPQTNNTESISAENIAKAIASFERTINSRNSPFDRWLEGENNAMTAQQVDGFKLFIDKNKGNCATCHHAPNFTDDGFHNLGLNKNSDAEADSGRYKLIPLKLMQGAFKTPGLRNIAETAPYFHDGSAATLEDVMEHYIDGGTPNPVLSPEMKPLKLSKPESDAIIAFLNALTSPVSKTPAVVSQLNREAQ